MHRRGRDHFADRAHAGAQGHWPDHVARRRYRRGQQPQPPALLYKGYRQEQGHGACAESCSRNASPRRRSAGIPLRLEEAIARGIDLSCDVAICGVDNNPARVAASRYFRGLGDSGDLHGGQPDGDHGYVFVQDKRGPCIGCLFPDMVNDDRYPCPGTPAIADILQAVGALAVYAVDTLLMNRPRTWNYRRISLPTERSTAYHGSGRRLRMFVPMANGAESDPEKENRNGEMEKE